MTLSPLQQALLRSTPARAAAAGLRWWHRHRLLVLTYHSVVDAPPSVRRGRYAPLYRNAVSAARFERQMRFLKARYHVADAADLRAFLRGEALPAPSVLLTFDDGLLNNHTVAWPILRQLGLTAVFFLPTAFLDAASAGCLRPHWVEEAAARLVGPAPLDERRQAAADALEASPAEAPSAFAAQVAAALKAMPDERRQRACERLRVRLPLPSTAALPADAGGASVLATMTWQQARAMAGEGAMLGAHTERHRILSRLPEAQARREVVRSVARVREETGRCLFFAYPNGTADDFTPACERACAEAGCLAAFTQHGGFNAPAPSRPMALRRIDVSPDHGLAAFRYVSSGTKRLVDRIVRGRQA